MEDGMTDEQFDKFLKLLEISIEGIIRKTDDKEEMIKKIKELLNKQQLKARKEVKGSRSPLTLYTQYRGN